MQQNKYLEENNLPKAIIVGLKRQNEVLFNYEMKELKALCEACEIEVIDSFFQNEKMSSIATYLGSGKIYELKELVSLREADCVVFNDELSPATLSNICDVVECEVIDRTMLILEIFEKRAKTKEAKLQVELAKLTYMLPRLIGSRKNLDRTGGGGGGRAGARRGAGESKLELDRRAIEARIYKIKQDLEEIKLSRRTSRKARLKSDEKIVAFVGYTNAGKSSTINSLLKMHEREDEKNVYVEDMLFATLDVQTRAIKTADNHTFLLTDTVGFVERLPHHLIESFKSTLEEIADASLIVHLIDASSPHLDLQIATTNKVLKELNVENIPLVYCFNKIDKVGEMNLLPKDFEPALYISNATGENLDKLMEYIDQTLYPNEVTTTLLIPYDKGNIYNILMEKASVDSFEYLADGIKVHVKMSVYLYNLYKEYEKEI